MLRARAGQVIPGAGPRLRASVADTKRIPVGIAGDDRRGGVATSGALN